MEKVIADGVIQALLSLLAEQEAKYNAKNSPSDSILLAGKVVALNEAIAIVSSGLIRGVDDSMVGRAMDAASEYWGLDGHWQPCTACKSTGAIQVTNEGDRDYCDACGGAGNLHAGTEEGAMRAALVAVLGGEK